MLTIIIPFGAALTVAYLLTPFVIRGAHHLGVLDVPTELRRAHKTPTPRLGGIAVAVAISVTCAGISFAPGASWRILTQGSGSQYLGFLSGTVIVFFAGLFDDIKGLSPRFKLIAQTIAAFLVVSDGLTPTALALATNGSAWHITEEIGAGLFVIWIVGVSNAFNLIDGLDGLAGSFSIIATGVTIISILIIQPQLSTMLPAIIAGAIIGFLKFNWNPARIFLGDAGAMTLGFVFAVLTVNAATSIGGITYPIIPLAALAFPLIDTLVAVARRWILGLPLSLADGRHIHHQLRLIGLKVPQVVTVLSAIFSCIACYGLLIVFAPSQFTLALLIAGAAISTTALLLGIRWLQYSEFTEFAYYLNSVLKNTPQVVRIEICGKRAAEKICQANSLSEIREILNGLAGQVGLLDIEIIEAPDRTSIKPPSQQISPANAPPMSLDYGIALRQSDAHRVIIRIWNQPNSNTTSHAMERTIYRVGTAVKLWYSSKYDEVMNARTIAHTPNQNNVT